MEGVSLAGSSLCLFCLAIACQSGPLADFNVCLGLVVAALFFQGFEISGVCINPIDLAPSYSGLLYGLMSGLSALIGTIAESEIMYSSKFLWSKIFVIFLKIRYL